MQKEGIILLLLRPLIMISDRLMVNGQKGGLAHQQSPPFVIDVVFGISRRYRVTSFSAT